MYQFRLLCRSNTWSDGCHRLLHMNRCDPNRQRKKHFFLSITIITYDEPFSSFICFFFHISIMLSFNKMIISQINIENSSIYILFLLYSIFRLWRLAMYAEVFLGIVGSATRLIPLVVLNHVEISQKRNDSHFIFFIRSVRWWIHCLLYEERKELVWVFSSVIIQTNSSDEKRARIVIAL